MSELISVSIRIVVSWDSLEEYNNVIKMVTEVVRKRAGNSRLALLAQKFFKKSKIPILSFSKRDFRKQILIKRKTYPHLSKHWGIPVFYIVEYNGYYGDGS